MTRVTELTPLLKSLKLGALAATLPERIALARREQLDYASFLEIILSDEVNRRAHRRTELRLHNAGFEELCRLEDFDWSASITLDRRLLDAVCSLEFLDKHEHVLLVGPAGVGKSFLAQALGYSAVRAGHAVRFIHADHFFRAMSQARVDNSVDRTFRSFLTPDLLILDDLGLHGLTAQQSADLYELILNRHRASSFIITSNRAVDEWLSLFDDPILGNSKPMPVVRAVQMRLTHMWPWGCKLTVSRVVRTEADQGLVRIARATAWPGSLATALLVTPSRGIPFGRL